MNCEGCVHEEECRKNKFCLKNFLTSQWIPCSERMPNINWKTKISEEVFVTVKRKTGYGVETSRTNGYIWLNIGIGEVVAWQPLPEPYKEV